MRPNLPKPPKMPKSWFRLPEWEREQISKVCNEAINAQVDHEEAQLQKLWLQFACIVLPSQKDPWGKMRCMFFLKGWKRVYRINSQFKTAEERDAWLKAEMEKIFGKDGYPHEWVDSLENGGKRE